MSREDVLNQAMTEPETVEVAGLKLRKMSLGTLSQLSRIGSPFADVKKTAAAQEDFRLCDIAEFVFIHGAPLEAVERIIYAQPGALGIHADRFAMCFPQSTLGEVMKAITSGAQEIVAAQAEVIPDPSLPASKNEPSPAA